MKFPGDCPTGSRIPRPTCGSSPWSLEPRPACTFVPMEAGTARPPCLQDIIHSPVPFGSKTGTFLQGSSVCSAMVRGWEGRKVVFWGGDDMQAIEEAKLEEASAQRAGFLRCLGFIPSFSHTQKWALHAFKLTDF